MLLVPLTLRAQDGLDTCIDFQYSALGQFPSGWSLVSDSGGSMNSRVSNDYITGSRNLVIYSFGRRMYLSTPDLGVDLGDGYWLRFWISTHSEAVTVGAMSDVGDSASFVPLLTVEPNQEGRFLVDLSPLPAGYRTIAFYCEKDVSSLLFWFKLDDVRVTQTPCAVYNFGIVGSTADSVIFGWEEVGTPEVSVLFCVGDSVVGRIDSLTGGRLALPRTAFEGRQVRLRASCPSPCDGDYESELQNVPYWDSSECVDLTVLHSNKCTPYYGEFTDPYGAVGFVNYGPGSVFSRHTVNSDTTMYDPVVGPSLRVIPPGEEVSVRLGNPTNGAEAEAMVYRLEVDTNVMDMLILKYAAVMEDPSHVSEQQPRFRIEMLDAHMNLIEPAECNSYDFISGPELGWNVVPGNTGVLWKDWTIVGIDLSSYHGQTVQLRLTVFDCAAGGHFGYAYYTLSCATKTIAFLSCSGGDSNLVAAPEGFSYRWHRDDEETTIGTTREMRLPMDNHYYYCDLGFIGNAACSVRMSVFSRFVSPVARMGYSVEREDCRFKVSLFDRSHLVDDTLHQPDHTHWYVDSFSVTERNPVVYLSDTGTYVVTLVSSLGGDGLCADTVTDTLHLTLPVEERSAATCANVPYAIGDTTFTSTGVYELLLQCDTLTRLRLKVLDTSLSYSAEEACVSYYWRDSLFTATGDYEIVYPNVYGCDSTFHLHLVVNPDYEVYDTLLYCAPGPYYYCGEAYAEPVEFDTTFRSIEGCDSLVHVTLGILDSSFHIRALHSADGRLWTDTVPVVFCSNQTLHLADSTPLAAAWQWRVGEETPWTTPTGQWRVDSIEQPITTTLTLLVSSVHGCTDSLSWPVVAIPSPYARFAWDFVTPVDIAPVVQFINYTHPEECEYLWLVQPGEDAEEIDSIAGYEPTYRWEQGDELPLGERDVRLEATWLFDGAVDSYKIHHACTDTTENTITIVTAFLQFPNLVTPNGDGINDRWEIVNLLELGIYPMNELWIYDAWGLLVFHERDINSPEQFWDPLETHSPDGTYYFRFSAMSRNGLVRLNGLIEVVR